MAFFETSHYLNVHLDLDTIITMSSHRNKPTIDPRKPWLTRPGGIKLSDWPSDTVTSEMRAKDAMWAKNGEKYNFESPIGGNHLNRYVKEGKHGPIYKNPPFIHRSTDDYVHTPVKPPRAKPTDEPCIAQLETKAAPNRQTSGPVQKKDIEKPAGERSSSRLQQKAQAAQELADKNIQNSTRQLMASPPVDDIARDSAIISTLPKPLINPYLPLATTSNLSARLEPVNDASLASVPAETASFDYVVNSKSDLASECSSTITDQDFGKSTKTADPSRHTVASKAATSIKSKIVAKFTVAGKTAATTISTASTRPTVTKKTSIAPQTESPTKSVAAIPETVCSSKDTNAGRAATQSVTGRKRNTSNAVPAKRPRIGRACDACRDKKTRCDGNKPCEACGKRKSDCTYGDGQLKLEKSSQEPNNGPPDRDGRSGQEHQNKKHLPTAKGYSASFGISSIKSRAKGNKRTREEECLDAAAEPHLRKKAKTVRTILRSPTAKAQMRADHQLDEEIQRHLQQHFTVWGVASFKRNQDSSDEETETRPAKLQRPTRYSVEVLNDSKLEAMQTVIYEFLAQSVSDFKPLQKIGQFVQCGKLSPQIIDISEQEEAFHNRPSIKLVLPDHIKGFLVDDWENVTKNNQLVHLPHPKPVETILQDYLAAERSNREEGSTQMDILEETIAGLREYFDRSLGRILLYR